MQVESCLTFSQGSSYLLHNVEAPKQGDGGFIQNDFTILVLLRNILISFIKKCNNCKL